MTLIRIDNITKHYGATLALDQVSLQIESGELFFLLGPSGCGKTTLLRILAGFVSPDSGGVSFNDRLITNLPPRSRDAGMVFQTYALWPHMTVARNVAYGLQVRGVKRAEIARRVEEVLKLVRLDGLGERRPNQLSGGQQQRVALARALIVEPHVLLLDEPLSNLDARLRDEMREEIRRIHAETGLTMVYVTHDQKEALALADRLALMDRGRLVQVGAPMEVYNRPTTRFAAGFLGDSNFIPGVVRDSGLTGCTVETSVGPLVGVPARDVVLPTGTKVLCSVRPHALTVASSESKVNRIAARIEQTSFMGEVLYVKAKAADMTLTLVTIPHPGHQLTAVQTVTLTVDPSQVVVLDEKM